MIQNMLKEVLKVKENEFRWKEDLNKRMKNIRKGNYMGKCVTIFLIS